MKAVILAALLLTGCVGTREGTYAAHGADLATTGVGFAMAAAGRIDAGKNLRAALWS